MEKRGSYLNYIILGLAVAVIGGCATKPKPPVSAQAPAQAQEAQPSSIQAESKGLAPSGDARFQKITFALSFGDSAAVKTWSVAIGNSKAIVKTMSGDVSNLPESVSWDGRVDSGALAPEGSYTATLGVDYGGAYKQASVSSQPFILDITPPSGSFSPNPAKFAYAADGATKPISVTVSVKPGLAEVSLWTIDIYDSVGGQVKSLAGTWPSAAASWDGKTDQGGSVEAGESFPAMLTVKDAFGNAGSFKGSFAVADIPGAENSSISTRRGGFSPTSTSVKNTLDLVTAIGSKSSVQTWTVQVMSATAGTIKTFKGGATEVPDYVRWDGTDDSGNAAPEGSYYATLAVDYGKAFKPALARSAPFSLVTTPPKGSVTVDPPTAALASLGPKNPVTLTVQAKSLFAQIASWTMGIYDDKGGPVAFFQANWPNNKVTWDGKSAVGNNLVPGVAYSVVAKVQDEYGNVGALNGSLSVEGLPLATEPSSIQALSAGFAPTGDKTAAQVDLAVEIGNLSSLNAWRVVIADEAGSVAKSFEVTAKSAPKSLSWDGKKDDGTFAPEGPYKATLSLDYGVLFAPASAASKPFILDLTPPTGTIGLSTDLFSPDGESGNDTVTISLDGSSKYSRIVSWSMTIYDPGDSVFLAKKGAWPAGAFVWDGKSDSGDLVESASAYPIDVKLRDEFGNVGEVKKSLNTDILVLKVGDGYRIRVSSIYFKAFTADYKDVPPANAEQNLATLKLLAAKLAKFPDYQVKLEGHAVMINWDNKARGEAEQKDILIPLSEARAVAIKNALIDRGISADRLMSSGVGADDPVVPNSDYANRWKNRRVEFYLLK
jgi:outer membrane protein OmpA-like peptidoglycan-associated protein/flagellar hook assembly protein FlgD